MAASLYSSSRNIVVQGLGHGPTPRLHTSVYIISHLIIRNYVFIYNINATLGAYDNALMSWLETLKTPWVLVLPVPRYSSIAYDLVSAGHKHNTINRQC